MNKKMASFRKNSSRYVEDIDSDKEGDTSLLNKSDSCGSCPHFWMGIFLALRMKMTKLVAKMFWRQARNKSGSLKLGVKMSSSPMAMKRKERSQKVWPRITLEPLNDEWFDGHRSQQSTLS